MVAGFDSATFTANDDLSQAVTIPFTIDFFGSNYSSMYLNNNGNLTFGQPLETYTPYPLSETGLPMIAAFFADVDTRTGNAVTYGTGTVDGHSAWGANWPNVGCYNEITSVLNNFQLLLIDRSDIAAGDFDVEFNYDQVQWETGTASGGSPTCQGGTSARAGYAAGSGATGTYYELPGSGVNGAFLDSNTATGLVHGSYNSSVPGRYVYSFRNGQPSLTSGAPVTATGVGTGGSGAVTHDPTCSTPRPVNCASGDFWHTFTDVKVGGRGPGLNVSRTYNSLAASSAGSFGYGWAWSYGQRLSTNLDGSATITAEDGAQVTAQPAAGGAYVLPTWTGSTLTHNGDGTWSYVRHQRQHLTFNSAGQLTGIADSNGYATTLGYVGGQVATITDSSGRSAAVAYNADGLISTITDPAGHITRYGYDGAGNLASVTDPMNAVTAFTYDTSHRPLTMTDARGGVTTNVYDTGGRVTRQTDPMNRVTTFAYAGDNYSASGGTTTITDPNGRVQTQQYTNGELIALTRGSGSSAQATWRFEYDQVTLGRTKITDPNGHITSLTYDGNGNLVNAVDALNRTTSLSYNGLNEPTVVTDPAGVATTFSYDTGGNLTSTSRPLTGTSQTQTTGYGYGDPAHPGDVTSVTDPNGKTWTFGYDGAGDLTRVTDPLGNASTFGYDGIGRRTSSVTPRGNVAGGNPAAFTTGYAYDDMGAVTSVTDPLGHVTGFGYDADHNRTTVTDPAGHVTTSTYDADNELTGITRADGTTLTYGYDGAGNQTSQTDGLNHTTTYAYDPLNRVSSTTDPLNRTTSYGYDPVGQLTSLTDAAGSVTSFGYDAAGQRTSISYSDGHTPNVTFGYTPDGQRASMVDGAGTTSYTYDSLNRLTTTTNGAGQTVSYGYDLAGHVTALTYPNGNTVSRGYDDAGRLHTITDWAGHTTTLSPDPDGNPAATVYGNGVTATSTFDAAGQLTATTDTAPGGAGLASFTYTRNTNNQLASTTPTGVTQGNETYSYTQLNQLAGVNTATYGYDAADNLTRLATGATLSYDAANEATSYTPATGSAVPFTYDQRGNRVTGTATRGTSASYSYDQANRLTSTTATNPGVVPAGANHSLAVKPDGTLAAWGANASGQLGDGTTNARSTPITVTGLTTVATAEPGYNHSLATKTDGTTWAWGANATGQLGTGDTTAHTTPVQISGLTGATALAAGNGFSLALLGDGTVKAWGVNTYGQLGDGTTTRLSPTTVPGLTGVVAIAAAGTHAVALKSDGTVWSWGHNTTGQLGDGTSTDRHSPVRSGTLTGITAIATAANGLDTIALKSDGTVWAWGGNGSGQLGDGTTTARTTPTQVPGLTGVTDIAAGSSHTLAVTTDGSVWAWGTNADGQLGQPATVTGSTSPLQIPSFTGVATVDAGTSHSLATKTDGTVWAWGQGSSGQLGNGTTASSSTPVQVTGVTSTSTTTTASYSYDGDGLRATRTAGGATQRFAWTISGLLLTDDTINYLYDDTGTPIEQIDNTGDTLYYQHDQYGSTRLLTNATGGLAATFSYDAYGNLTGRTGTDDTPLRWNGQYQDTDTGLYYLRARYYDPATGQFLTRDPMEAYTQTPYTYAGGDPLNHIDPTGLSTVGICGAATIQGIAGFSADECLTRVLDTKHIGITGALGLSVSAGEDLSAGAYYQVSNANQLSDLSGLFYYATVAGQYLGGAAATVFWTPNILTDFPHATYGIQFGPAFGVGVELGVGASYTWVQELSGPLGAIARGAWNTLTPVRGVPDVLAHALDLINDWVGHQC